MSIDRIPRDVITDADLLQGYLDMLSAENYIKARIRRYRGGKSGIDPFNVNKSIHVLARAATQHEAISETYPGGEN